MTAGLTVRELNAAYTKVFELVSESSFNEMAQRSILSSFASATMPLQHWPFPSGYSLFLENPNLTFPETRSDLTVHLRAAHRSVLRDLRNGAYEAPMAGGLTATAESVNSIDRIFDQVLAACQKGRTENAGRVL